MENQKRGFFRRLFHAGTSILAWLKILFFLIVAGFVAYAGWWLYHHFSVTETKTETYLLKNVHLAAKEKVIISEITGMAVGRYGYRKVINSNLPLIGERHDTLCWQCPGSRFVDIDDSAMIEVGYDMLAGDRLYSDNATYTECETKDSFIVIVATDYPVPHPLNKILPALPHVSNSLMEEKISSSEIKQYENTKLDEAGRRIIADRQDFFQNSYQKCMIEILAQTFALESHGKIMSIRLVVNGKPYFPEQHQAVNLENQNFNLDKTIFK